MERVGDPTKHKSNGLEPGVSAAIGEDVITTNTQQHHADSPAEHQHEPAAAAETFYRHGIKQVDGAEGAEDGYDSAASSPRDADDGVDDEFVDVGEEIETIINEQTAHHHRRHYLLGGGAGGTTTNKAGFGFDRPIEPLCVAANYSGSRICVGHTRGFVLYAVRRVDGRQALFEIESQVALAAEQAAAASRGGGGGGGGSVSVSADSTTSAFLPTRLNPFPLSVHYAQQKRNGAAAGGGGGAEGNTSTSASSSPPLGSSPPQLPFTQLVPIVSFDEDDRLTCRRDEGIRRPFANLQRYGIAIERGEAGGGGGGANSVSGSAVKRQGTAEAGAEDDDDDDDCEWGTSAAVLEDDHHDHSSSTARGYTASSSASAAAPFAGAGTVSLLFETTFVGVVGGGPRPMGPPNKLHIFSGTTLTQTITASGPIERLMMTSGSADRSTQVAMLTRDQYFLIYLFDGSLVYRAPTHTINNCLSQPLTVNSRKCLVSFPSASVGGVEVARYSDSSSIRRTCTIPKAHTHPISSIALSADADVCVTCSTHGTLIRVWDIREGSPQQGTMLSELRTSPIPCRIRHVGVSTQGNYIYALVNSVNVCVFFIGKEEEAKAYDVSTKDPSQALAKNTSSYLSKLAFLSTFFKSKWAASTLGLPPAMLPATLLKGAEYYGQGGVRGGGASATRNNTAMFMHSAAPSSVALQQNSAVGTPSPSLSPSSVSPPPPPQPAASQASLTGGLWSRLYGGGGSGAAPNTTTPRAIGGGDPIVPTTSSASAAGGGGDGSGSGGGGYYSYYASGLVSSLYGAASKTATMVAAASGVSVAGGGYGGGVVVGGASGAKGSPSDEASAAGGNNSAQPSASNQYSSSSASSSAHPHQRAPARDVNGRTADDVLALWWEQHDYVHELSGVVPWDGYDLEGFYRHVEATSPPPPPPQSSAAPQQQRNGAAKGGNANKSADGAVVAPSTTAATAEGATAAAASAAPPSSSVGGTVVDDLGDLLQTLNAVASGSNGNGGESSSSTSGTAAAAVPKEVLCIVNGYGEMLRVEFSPVGGKLVPLPMTPAKE